MGAPPNPSKAGVISIGCFMSYGSAVKGPPVFYAEHRRPTLNGCKGVIWEPYKIGCSRGRHANLALLSLVGSINPSNPSATLKGLVLYAPRVFYALHRRPTPKGLLQPFRVGLIWYGQSPYNQPYKTG
jgi:hypothetical protein